MNTKASKVLNRIKKDIKNGKNLSPSFDNAEEAFAWLKNKGKHKKSWS